MFIGSLLPIGRRNAIVGEVGEKRVDDGWGTVVELVEVTPLDEPALGRAGGALRHTIGFQGALAQQWQVLTGDHRQDGSLGVTEAVGEIRVGQRSEDERASLTVERPLSFSEQLAHEPRMRTRVDVAGSVAVVLDAAAHERVEAVTGLQELLQLVEDH